MNQIHAFTDDALGTLDAIGIADRLRYREVSLEEVVASTQKRLERVESHISAVELNISRPLERFPTRPLGIFAGVPTYIKDNVDLMGFPTRAGSAAIPERKAKDDDPFVRQFLSMGFVPLGKSRMPEFGLNASTEYRDAPPTRNPWNLEYSAGASSGGAAALVASGVVALAHANDGGGSIRIPAASCGLVGLKPSRGRLISSRSARSLPINLVGEGVLSRSVRDTAHFLYGAESYYHNPKLPPIGLVHGPSNQTFRIALVQSLPTGVAIDPEVQAALQEIAQLLEAMGHTVEDMPTVPVPASFAEDFTIYWGLLAFAASTLLPKLYGPEFDASQLDELTKGLAALYRKNMHKTPLVLYRLHQAATFYQDAMAGFDVILSPVLAHTTPKLGYLKPDQQFDELFERLRGYVGFTPLNNVTGTPALSLPLAKTQKGLPLGIHFAGKYGQERVLLELAYALEEARPWRFLYQEAASTLSSRAAGKSKIKQGFGADPS
jgi:amidase